METLKLGPRRMRVEIADTQGEVVKVLTLQEMSASRTEEFSDYLEAFDFKPNGDESLTELIEKHGEKTQEFVSWLFGEKLDSSFIHQYITPSMVVQLIVAQNTLNGLDELIKKAQVRLLDGENR